MSAVNTQEFALRCADGGEVYRSALMEACHPRPVCTVSEWADRSRILLSEASAEPGPWRTARTPYLQEPMDSLSVHIACPMVVMKCGTQVGKTEVLLNWAGYVMQENPGPMLIVQPTSDTGKRFSRQRLQPMIEASPVLAALVVKQKSRDSGNTIKFKEFPGGACMIGGANSSPDLTSTPVRYAAEDECDRYPTDLDDQGSVGNMVDRRTSSFGARRKRLRVSTPTIAECSEIDASYLATDRRSLHVPCPICDVWDTLSDEQITPDGEYLCPDCGQLYTEAAGKSHWYGSAPAKIRWIAERPGVAARGYWLPSWYSALGLGYTWAEIAKMRDESVNDPLAAKTYANTIQGLTYADATYRVDASRVLERREDYTMRTLPPGAMVLTAAVDVQANRFVVAIWAWGRGEVGWLIDAVELPGSPLKPEDWESVHAYLSKPLRNSYGRLVSLSAVGVDTGNWTQECYQFVRPRQPLGYHALKGQGTPGKAIIAGRPSRVDISAGGRALRTGVALWNVGTEAAKATLMGRMQHDDQVDEADRLLRFPGDVSDDVLLQLCAERFDPERKRFVKIVGRRNDFWDCLVYSYAMALHPTVRLHVMREHDWLRLENELEPPTVDMFDGVEADSVPPASPPVPVVAEESDIQSGFIRAPAGPFIKRRRQ